MIHTKHFAHQIHLSVLIVCVLAISIALVVSTETLSPLVSAAPLNSQNTSPAGHAKKGKGIFRYACADCHHATDPAKSERKLNGFNLARENETAISVSQFWRSATELHLALGKATREHSNAAIAENEVYDLTAYVLHLNGFITEEQAVDQKWLRKFSVSNTNGFGTVWPKR